MALTVSSQSAAETLRMGANLASRLEGGAVVGLTGRLGTGKSVFVRGMARGLGHAGPVPSPTFTIIRTYPSIGLCHVDAFRLEEAGQLIQAGMEEFLDERWICAVEWADRVRGALPQDAIMVTISFTPSKGERILQVEGPPRFIGDIKGESRGDV